jgi:hypothetical protein
MSGLKEVSVKFTYKTINGSRSEATYSTKHLRHDMSKPTPEDVIVGFADELARIAAIDGYGDKVEEAVKDARRRVAEWEAKRG